MVLIYKYSVLDFVDRFEPDPYLPPELVIRGEKGTVAEKWAKKQYAKFEEIE